MVNQELILFVRAELTKGKTQEDIRAELLSGGGWTGDDIDQVFGIVNPSTPPPTVSPQAIMPIQPFEVMPVQKPIEIKPKSSMGTILIILVILLSLGGAVWYFNLHTYLLSLVLGPAIGTDTPLAPSAEPKVQLKDLNAETPVIINDSIPSISEEGIYTDTKNGFKITPPSGWTLENKTQQTETVASFIAGNQTAEIGQKIDISILDTTAVEADLVKYVDTMIQVMPKVMPGYKLISKNKINVNGTEMILVDATSDYGEIMGKKMNGRMYQMYSLKNGKIYMVSGLVSPINTWSKYEKDIKKSLLSFNFDISTQKAETVSPDTNTKTYKNEKIGFQFEYPADLVITSDKAGLNTLATPTKDMLELSTDGANSPMLLLSVNAIASEAEQKDEMNSIYEMSKPYGATRSIDQIVIDGTKTVATIDNIPAGTNPKYNIPAKREIWAIFTKNTNTYLLMYLDKKDSPDALKKFKDIALSFRFIK